MKGKSPIQLLFLIGLAVIAAILAGCSTQKNTAQSRWWHAFNARYNTYYNGTVAYIDGALEKEEGNRDNFTEQIPLYTVGNRNSRDLGKANFDRAIEKCVFMESVDADGPISIPEGGFRGGCCHLRLYEPPLLHPACHLRQGARLACQMLYRAGMDLRCRRCDPKHTARFHPLACPEGMGQDLCPLLSEDRTLSGGRSVSPQSHRL